LDTPDLVSSYKQQNQELKTALFDLFDQYDYLNEIINELKNDNTFLLENQMAQNELIKEYEYEIQILMLKTQQQQPEIYPPQMTDPNEMEYYEEVIIINNKLIYVYYKYYNYNYFSI